MGTHARAHAGCSGHGPLAGNLTTGEVLPVNGVAIGHGKRVCEAVNVEFTGVVEANNGEDFRC